MYNICGSAHTPKSCILTYQKIKTIFNVGHTITRSNYQVHLSCTESIQDIRTDIDLNTLQTARHVVNLSVSYRLYEYVKFSDAIFQTIMLTKIVYIPSSE